MVSSISDSRPAIPYKDCTIRGGGLYSGFCFFIACHNDDFSKKACHVTQAVEKFILLCYTFVKAIIKRENSHMKKIYLIGGAMGVGKTTVMLSITIIFVSSVTWNGSESQHQSPSRKTLFDNFVFKICASHLLNNFIHCSAYDNIIFCWVMHEQSIIDDILSRLDHKDCKVYCVSLVCDPDVLSERLRKDIEQGVRLPSIIEKSISYLPKYRLLYTKRIDVSNSSPNQIADEIAAL